MMGRAFLGGALGVALMGIGVGPFIATATPPTVAHVEVEYLLSAVAGYAAALTGSSRSYSFLTTA
jgi:hypothetical protein